MECRALWRLSETAPRGLQLPQCTANLDALLHPPSPFGFSGAATSVYRLRVGVLGIRVNWLPVLRCLKAPVIVTIIPHVKSFCSTIDEARRGKKGRQLPGRLVVCEPSPIAAGTRWILGLLRKYVRVKQAARGTESPFSSCNRCRSVFS